MGGPHYDRDAGLLDIACELPDLAGRLASMKEQALIRLSTPEYDALRVRLEVAHSTVEAAAVEARRRARLNEGHEHRA
jgi:hypothetical protein